MRVTLDRRWRVRLWVEVGLPIEARRVWLHVRRVERFATRDPFHWRVSLDGPARVGCAMVIEHRYAGWRVDRVGRILRWDEGRGYAFSDLSKRGPGVGFPHIYEYRVAATGAGSCMVIVRVRGTWTARAWPRWAVRLWLSGVALAIGKSIENHMLMTQLRARRRFNRRATRSCRVG
ncbi:MAG: hypothetical protein NTW19_14795 [Planctomycetota bacterium]|nr:hypothetical protein [Planctomycetota bacterium]